MFLSIATCKQLFTNKSQWNCVCNANLGSNLLMNDNDDVRNIFNRYIKHIFTALLFRKFGLRKIVGSQHPFTLGRYFLPFCLRENSRFTASSHLRSIFLTISLMSSKYFYTSLCVTLFETWHLAWIAIQECHPNSLQFLTWLDTTQWHVWTLNHNISWSWSNSVWGDKASRSLIQVCSQCAAEHVNARAEMVFYSGDHEQERCT